jgi:hypothetical protein
VPEMEEELTVTSYVIGPADAIDAEQNNTEIKIHAALLILQAPGVDYRREVDHTESGEVFEIVRTAGGYASTPITLVSFCALANCAVMWRADLEGANLTDAKGLTLSENNIRNARFSPNADDDWSVLRRTYTGACLLFHVLLMLAFFLPFVAKTFYWVAMNNAQHYAQTLYSDVAKAVSTHPELESAFQRVEAALKQRNELLKQRNELRRYAIWQLLLGVDRGIPTAMLTFDCARDGVGGEHNREPPWAYSFL